MSVTVESTRIERLLRVLVGAWNGDYSVRIPLEDIDDDFLEVELGINYLLMELDERRLQNDAQRGELLAKSQQLAAQQDELLAALSTPIISLWRGLLALPLVGHVDEARAATITAIVLERVSRERASHVLIDLTGVGALGPATMPALLRMVQAIRLLGATCLLTGIRPEVARQIVELGPEDTPIRALAHMSDALALVLAEKGALRR